MKRFLKASTFLCVVVAIFAALLLKGEVTGAAGAPPFERLNAVTAVSAHNIWAVGDSFSGGVDQPLIEHWNGAHWSIVPAADPNPGASTDELEGVTEVSASDVWAVGIFTDTNGNGQPLIEHWNGSQWSIVPSAQLPVGFPGGNLLGIEEVSAYNIWAVGSSILPSGTEQPLIEHWNGKKWSVVPSPDTGSNTNSLSGVAEVSAQNIWAVGSLSSSLTEHWNGSSWNIVSTPDPKGSVASTRAGIAEVSNDDIWSVGSYTAVVGGVGINHTLIEHWNGTVWRIISSPNSGTTDNDFLFGVAAISTNNAWAVGTIITTGSNAGQPLIEHWDGMRWNIVPGAS